MTIPEPDLTTAMNPPRLCFQAHWSNGQLVRLAICLTVACLCVLGAGCASSGVVANSTGPVNSGSISHDTIVVETTSDASNSETQRKLLNALIMAGLQQSGKFKRVAGIASQVDSTPQLKLTARIKDVSKVSDGARLLVGALAGQAGIVVDVSLSDPQKGEQIAAFQATGKSSSGAFFQQGSTTDFAVQRAAEQIVAEVLKRH